VGSYLKAQKSRKRTVTETLIEAEEDHLLDCPNADFSLRAAATLLDIILFFLAYSGLKHLCNALNTHLAHFQMPFPGAGAPKLQLLLFQLSLHHETFSQTVLLLLRISLAYFYFVWALAYAGGSPGKLLLGLRVIHSQTGRYLNFFHALARELGGKIVSVVTLYGFFSPFLRKDKKALHDIVFRTSVKKVHGVR